MTISNAANCPSSRKARALDALPEVYSRPADGYQMLGEHPQHLHDDQWISEHLLLAQRKDHEIGMKHNLRGVVSDRSLRPDKVGQAEDLLLTIAQSTGKSIAEIVELVTEGEEHGGEWGGLPGAEDFDAEWGFAGQLRQAVEIYLESKTAHPTLHPTGDHRDWGRKVQTGVGGSGGVFDQPDFGVQMHEAPTRGPTMYPHNSDAPTKAGLPTDPTAPPTPAPTPLPELGPGEPK